MLSLKKTPFLSLRVSNSPPPPRASSVCTGKFLFFHLKNPTFLQSSISSFPPLTFCLSFYLLRYSSKGGRRRRRRRREVSDVEQVLELLSPIWTTKK
jgi:hypothetical protein